MGKLIELEWRKNRIGNWVRWAALLGAALGLLIFAMAFLGIANDPEPVCLTRRRGMEGSRPPSNC